MDISKKAECKISREVTIVAVTNNFIVVNTGKNGITIFDTALNIVREMSLGDNLAIHHMYTNATKNELIAYCPDNGCVIWVDLANAVHKVMPLPEALSERILSPAYYWLGDLVIFIDSQFWYQACELEEYYELNISTSTWDTINHNVLSYASPELANLIETIFINGASDFRLFDGYIVEDRADEPEVTVVIYRTFFRIDRPQFAYHDILYAYNMIVFVGLEQLQIFIPSGDQHDRDYQKMMLDAPEGYQFLKVVIDSGSYGLRLITLCTGRQNSLLVVYQVYGVAQQLE